MTELQRMVFAETWSINFDRSVHSIDPRLDGEKREEYLRKASQLATVAAYQAARRAPGEA